PLPGSCYVCLGAQPCAVSRSHYQYVRERGGVVEWASAPGDLGEWMGREYRRLAESGCHVYVTVDADAFHAADVPGVSAPNAAGLRPTDAFYQGILELGTLPRTASLDVVEVNPCFDRDGQTCRWAALVVWYFLAGVARRGASSRHDLQ